MTVLVLFKLLVLQYKGCMHIDDHRFLKYFVFTDGIIIGGSSLKHVNDNMVAFNDGPLDPSKYLSLTTYWSVVLCLCTQV